MTVQTNCCFLVMEGTTDAIGENISSHGFAIDSFGQCCSAGEHFADTEKNIWIYASPVIIILGTIGNILSGRIMLGKRLRKHTTSVYLIALAVVDTFILYSNLPWAWIDALFNINVLNLSVAYCKISIFLLFYVIQLQAWILVCVNIERFTAVFLPLKAKKLFTKRSALIQMAIAASLLFMINSHIFWTQTLVDYGYGNTCAEHPDFVSFRLRVYSWVGMMLSPVVPSIIMFFSSIAMSVKLYMQSKIGGGSGGGKTTTVSIMLITVCLVFILCALPITIFLTNTEYFLHRYGCCFSWRVIWPLLNMVMYTNNAINFILYSISGPRFRAELRQMFPWCKRHKVDVDASATQNSVTNS